jgi:hypothetical protein
LFGLADVEKDAAQLPDMRSPFDQALDLQKGSGSIPAALMPNMSEPIPLSPLSTRFTDEGLEACVSQHLATEAITLEWRVRPKAGSDRHKWHIAIGWQQMPSAVHISAHQWILCFQGESIPQLSQCVGWRHPSMAH